MKKDEHIFMEMIEKHKGQFYRIAFSYTKNEHDALDVIQESVCKAYENLDKLKEISYLKTWFVRILINTAISMGKKQKRIVPSQETSEIINHNQSPSDLSNDFSNDVVNKIDVMEALDLLNDHEKSIVLLRFFEDYKLEDVAKSLDIPLNTTKSTLYRALKKMKITLEEVWKHD